MSTASPAAPGDVQSSLPGLDTHTRAPREQGNEGSSQQVLTKQPAQAVPGAASHPQQTQNCMKQQQKIKLADLKRLQHISLIFSISSLLSLLYRVLIDQYQQHLQLMKEFFVWFLSAKESLSACDKTQANLSSLGGVIYNTQNLAAVALTSTCPV